MKTAVRRRGLPADARTIRRALELSRDVAATDTGRKARRATPAPEGARPARRFVRLTLVFVASVIVVDALVGDRGLLAMMRARRQHDELAATIARSRAENARLREQVRRLKEDPATIEDLARRQLGMIRPGEKLFIIRDIKPPTATARP